jgi:uncharacterized protein YndB with AHSA1/START domain
MATIRHHAHIARSPNDVWKVVSDAGAISNWFPGIDTSSVDGGARQLLDGRYRACGGDRHVDDELRRFQYRITDGPMALEFHLGTVDVLAHDDGSLVIYSTEVSPDEAKPLFDPAIASGVDGLKRYLEG